LVACLVAVAFAQTKEYETQPGYDLNTEVAKAGGVFKIKVNNIVAQLWPSNSTAGYGVYLRVVPSAASLTTGGALVKIWVNTDGAFNPTPSTATAPTYQKAAAGIFANFDYMLPAAGTYYIWGLMDCGSCSSTGEVKIGLWTVLMDTRTPKLLPEIIQPFQIRDNSYTADYSLPVNMYGAAGLIILGEATKIYLKVDLQTTSQTGQVVMVYKKTTTMMDPPSPIDGDPTTKDEVMDMWYKYPTGSPSDGDYSTGPKSLSPGMWFIAPYCKKTAPGGSVGFDFAVGINHEPSGTNVVVPSLAILAMLASSLVAYLL